MEVNNETFKSVDGPEDAGMDIGGIVKKEPKARKAREPKAVKKSETGKVFFWEGVDGSVKKLPADEVESVLASSLIHDKIRVWEGVELTAALVIKKSK